MTQAKPLVFTLLIVALAAFMADLWLLDARPGRVVRESSTLAIPVPTRVPKDTVAVYQPPLVLQDSTEQARLLAQKLKDLMLVAKIEQRLFRARLMKPYSFEVSAKNGTVTIQGTVLTEETGRKAERIVRAMEGVDHVVNQTSIR